MDNEISKYIIDTVKGVVSHVTLREFCLHHGITMEQSKVSSMGRKLSAASKEKGVEVRKRFDERYGSVNTYYIEILREEFKDEISGESNIRMSREDEHALEDLADGMDQYREAMKRGVWIDTTAKEHKISEMNTRHIKAVVAMLDRDHWPLNIANGYKKLFAEEIKNKPKMKDIGAEELSERLMSAENNMWKSASGLIKYKDMGDGHLLATMKMIKRFDWPDVLKDAYLDGMKKEHEGR